MSRSAAEYTPPGTHLAVGEAAIVPHRVPGGPKVAIELTVVAVEEGALGDFHDYDLPPEVSDKKPYYVHYAVTNLSDEDLSHQSFGTLKAVDDRGEPNAAVIAEVEECTRPFGSGLTEGQTYEFCEIYMIHETGSLRSVTYQGPTSTRHEPGVDPRELSPHFYDPVTWNVRAVADADASAVLRPLSCHQFERPRSVSPGFL